jgi:proline dehydrogenase
MVNSLLVRASENDRLERLVTGSRWTRRVALRFVAGEDIADGLDAAERLAGMGRWVSLDYVGERIRVADDARAAAAMYERALDGVAERALPSGISVKPTQLGLTSHPDLCAELLDEVAKRAADVGAHVTLDMEDASVTEPTVALVEAMHEAGHDHVGCAVQSYLHRTESDVVRLSAVGASLRLCKGAYAEPAHLAYQAKADVDASYRRSASWLLRHGTYPRFATHDHRIVDYIRREAERLGRAKHEFEFQMLYGVRPELQASLTDDGCRVCVYVPFGDRWYAYFMRRLAERPANMLFFLRALRGTTDQPARAHPTA